MRIRWLSCILLFLVSGPTIQARDHLDIQAVLDVESRTISGRVAVEFEARGAEYSDLRFRLYPNLECEDDSACGIRIDSIKVGALDVTPRLTVSGTDAHVELERKVAASETLNAEIWFTTKIPAGEPRLGVSRREYTLTGWFPMPAPWSEGRWERVRYQSFLEPAADLADIRGSITYPDSLPLIAPGILASDTGAGQLTAELQLKAAAGLPLFFGTGYRLDTTTVNGAKLKIYYQDEDLFMVDTVRTAATAAMSFMSDYVMPYPHDELIIVVGGLSAGGGLEQPRMILASAPPRTVITRLYAAMITHEVVHQWFYGIVNSNQAETPWLDEAVTEYFAHKIGSYRAGDDPDLLDLFGLTANHLTLTRLNARSVFETYPVDLPGSGFYNNFIYYRTVYRKGTLVLHTLGALMGEENEQFFWQDYARSFKYEVPHGEDFVRLANNYLPASDRSDAATILKTLAPTDFSVVSLSSEPASADSTGEVADEIFEWKTTIEYQAKHPLGFPVDLRVTFIDGAVIDTVVNPGPGVHRVEFVSNAPALAAVMDPQIKYAIDVDYLNNSIDRERSRGAALRLFSGVTFLVESLFSSLWGW